MKIKTLKGIANAIGAKDYMLASARIEAALENESGKDWNKYLTKLSDMLSDESRLPVSTILAAAGNSKLPFLAFSVLPAVTCSGAGACLEYCYSFKAWRYPAAFVRQCSNTILMQSDIGRAHITKAFEKYQKKAEKKGEKITFRLYVDGDFDSLTAVNYWFDLLNRNSWLSAYGYSKSFTELLSYTGKMPTNYLLNVSGGHNHTLATVEKIKALPFTRGEFIAVSTGKSVKSSDHANPAHRSELIKLHKANTGNKSFACAGLCGECTSAGHACGSDKFQGMDIIIAVH